MARRTSLTLTLALGCGPAAPPNDGHGPHGHAHEHGHAHGQAHEHGHAHGQAHDTVHHDFSDAARWSKEFDDPARDAWQKPDEVVRSLAISAGMTAVDLGAGTGYFAKRLSAAVGPSGKVIALDPEPNMIAFMRERFQREALANAEARVCPTDSTGLEPESADRVLVVNTWHHIEKRGEYAKHLSTVLKKDGMVMIVDFTQAAEQGPPKEHRILPEAVIAELANGGLEARLLDETLPDHYVVVGVKRVVK